MQMIVQLLNKIIILILFVFPFIVKGQIHNDGDMFVSDSMNITDDISVGYYIANLSINVDTVIHKEEYSKYVYDYNFHIYWENKKLIEKIGSVKLPPRKVSYFINDTAIFFCNEINDSSLYFLFERNNKEYDGIYRKNITYNDFGMGGIVYTNDNINIKFKHSLYIEEIEYSQERGIVSININNLFMYGGAKLNKIE